MGKIRFVHCSDIHLGANPYALNERFEDMGKAFSYVCRYALENKAQFMVIAGDFFDKKVLNAKTLEQAIDIIKELNDKNIKIFVTEGNHDKSTYVNSYSWLEFMSQKGYITLLTPYEDKLEVWNSEEARGSIYEGDDYLIYGLGYPGVLSSKYIDTLSSQYIENKDNKVVITMLHTGVEKFLTEGMGGIRNEDAAKLSDKSDYIALGHIHKRYEDAEYKYYNPGSLENTSIPKENEEKGFYLVEIDSASHEASVEFIKAKSRMIVNIKVDITDFDNTIDINEGVRKEIEKSLEGIETEKIIVQVKIVGSGSSYKSLDINSLKDEIKETYNLLYIEIQNKINVRGGEVYTEDSESTRSDIENKVIKELIEEENFKEDDIKDILKIALSMKEIAGNAELSLDTSDGENVLEEILKYVRK